MSTSTEPSAESLHRGRATRGARQSPTGLSFSNGKWERHPENGIILKTKMWKNKKRKSAWSQPPFLWSQRLHGNMASQSPRFCLPPPESPDHRDIPATPPPKSREAPSHSKSSARPADENRRSRLDRRFWLHLDLLPTQRPAAAHPKRKVPTGWRRTPNVEIPGGATPLKGHHSKLEDAETMDFRVYLYTYLSFVHISGLHLRLDPKICKVLKALTIPNIHRWQLGGFTAVHLDNCCWPPKQTFECASSVIPKVEPNQLFFVHFPWPRTPLKNMRSGSRCYCKEPQLPLDPTCQEPSAWNWRS